MNLGTKIRTALRVAVSINTAVYAVSAAVTGLGFGKLTFLWTVLTIASDFVVSAITTYYNNDYTEEAHEATIEMRLLKKKEDLPVDYFESEEGGEDDG